MASKFVSYPVSTTKVPVHETVFRTMQYLLPVPHQLRLSWNVVVCANGVPIHFDSLSRYDGFHLDCFYEVPLDALLSWMEGLKKIAEGGELAYLLGVCGLRKDPEATTEWGRHTVDYNHYLDNLKIPLKTAVRGGKVFDKGPLACHVHAVRRMYPILRNRNDVQWAVHEIYHLAARDYSIGCTDKYRLRMLPAMQEYREEMGGGDCCYDRMAAVVDLMDLTLDVRNVGCNEDECINCKPYWDKTIYDAAYPHQLQQQEVRALANGKRDRSSFLSFLDRRLYYFNNNSGNRT